MDERVTPIVPPGPGGRRHRGYSAPGLWPASSRLRTGALITIAVVLAVVVLLYFRPWTSSDDGYPYSSPYGLGPGVASLHGGGQR